MDNLYREDLMDIYKHPQNRGTLADPSVSVTKKNPMCGDVLTFQLKIDNGIVTDAKFDGMACSVSIISAALLTEKIIGKTLENAANITKTEFLDSIGLNLSTSRVKCATLALNALEEAIKAYDSKNE